MKHHNLVRKIRRAQAQSATGLLLAGAMVLLRLGMDTAGASTINLQPNPKAKSPDNYNFNYPGSSLRLGLTGSLAVGYDDNYNASHDKQGSFFTQPGLALSVLWEPSPNFSLSTNAGASYKYYSDSEAESGFTIYGDEGAIQTAIQSELKLGQTGRLFIGDSISRTMDNLEISSTNRNKNKDYARLTNDTWVQYENDLNDSLHGKVRYDHTMVWVTPDEYKYESYQSDTLDSVLLYDLDRNLQVGPYFTAGMRYYSDSVEYGGIDVQKNDVTSFAGGLAFTFVPSPNVITSGRLGYAIANFEEGADPFASDDAATPTYDIRLTYFSTNNTSHTFFSSYDVNEDYIDIGHNYSLDWRNGYAINHKFNEWWSVRGDVVYRNADISDDGGTNETVRFGAGVSYQLTRKASLDFRYEYTTSWANSGDDDSNDYDRNVISLTLVYRF